MSYAIAQSSEPAGKGWWDWKVWIDASDAELNKINFVEYTLHSTFPNRVRLVQDRSTNFRLEAGGWGEFMIYAKVHITSGEVVPLRHWLNLGTRAPAILAQIRGLDKEQPGKSVFLSAAIADEPFADALQEALEGKGFNVVRASDDADLPPRASIEAVLEKADAAVLVLSDAKSPWMSFEVNAIQSRKLPIVPVIIGPGKSLPSAMGSLEAIQLKGGDPAEAEPVAERIRDSLKLV